MTAPVGYESLVSGNVVPAHKLDEARMVWIATRQQLAATPADLATAERMVWLTVMLRNTFTVLRVIRALTEGALEVLILPRHRQLMLGILSREAAKEGDLQSAHAWLECCDPAAEDLLADSAYRISRALLESCKGSTPRCSRCWALFRRRCRSTLRWTRWRSCFEPTRSNGSAASATRPPG